MLRTERNSGSALRSHQGRSSLQLSCSQQAQLMTYQTCWAAVPKEICLLQNCERMEWLRRAKTQHLFSILRELWPRIPLFNLLGLYKSMGNTSRSLALPNHPMPVEEQRSRTTHTLLHPLLIAWKRFLKIIPTIGTLSPGIPSGSLSNSLNLSISVQLMLIKIKVSVCLQSNPLASSSWDQ